MRYPNPNMLLRIAQGDAFGMATEYIKPEHENLKQEALKFEKYLKHPTHNLKPGQYTDDTQMSIAVAEVLLDGNLTREAFAESFVRCFHRDQRDGYARGFQAFLEKTHSGADFLANIRPDSDKNGAAMRSVPLGVLPLTELMRVAELQAKLTHDTAGGIISSQLVALMSHYALYEEGPLSALPEWIYATTWEAAPTWKGPVVGPNVGMKTAWAVLTLVSQEKSLLDILKRTIEWGGDTDSVAAIAWGIASTRMTEELPDFFLYSLETGRPFGVDYLLKLGRKLTNKYL